MNTRRSRLGSISQYSSNENTRIAIPATVDDAARRLLCASNHFPPIIRSSARPKANPNIKKMSIHRTDGPIIASSATLDSYKQRSIQYSPLVDRFTH